MTWWIAGSCCNTLSSMAPVYAGTKTEVARISKKFSARVATFATSVGITHASSRTMPPLLTPLSGTCAPWPGCGLAGGGWGGGGCVGGTRGFTSPMAYNFTPYRCIPVCIEYGSCSFAPPPPTCIPPLVCMTAGASAARGGARALFGGNVGTNDAVYRSRSQNQGLGGWFVENAKRAWKRLPRCYRKGVHR